MIQWVTAVSGNSVLVTRAAALMAKGNGSKSGNANQNSKGNTPGLGHGNR